MKVVSDYKEVVEKRLVGQENFWLNSKKVVRFTLGHTSVSPNPINRTQDYQKLLYNLYNFTVSVRQDLKSTVFSRFNFPDLVLLRKVVSTNWKCYYGTVVERDTDDVKWSVSNFLIAIKDWYYRFFIF